MPVVELLEAAGDHWRSEAKSSREDFLHREGC
jgi:hypothetical protein